MSMKDVRLIAYAMSAPLEALLAFTADEREQIAALLERYARHISDTLLRMDVANATVEEINFLCGRRVRSMLLRDWLEERERREAAR